MDPAAFEAGPVARAFRAGLDPDAAAVIEHLAQSMSVAAGWEPRQVRAGFDAVTAWFREPAVPAADLRSEDRTVDGPQAPVPVRVYTPPGGHTQDIVVYIHGGGWVVGGLDSADATARTICRVVEAQVVSVDYRLAPEHPYPAATADCAAVVRWAAQAQPRWLAVAGDSAGGNLAAVTANAYPEVVDGQLLLYPALDPRQDTASYRDFADGPLLTADTMSYYWRSYATSEQLRDPAVAPLLSDRLETAPPAVVVTAHFDPLRDEGRAYAARLVEAGVPTVYLPVAGLPHGFADMTDRVPAAGNAVWAAASAFAGLRDRAIGSPRWARERPGRPAQRS